MASCNTSLVPLRVMLFAFYGAIGCVVPFLSLHMASLGLTADERSWVEFVAPLACGVGPLLGAVLADRMGNYRPLLVLALLVAAAAYPCLLLVPPVQRLPARPAALELRCAPDGTEIHVERCGPACVDGDRTERAYYIHGCRYRCEEDTEPPSVPPHLCLEGTSEPTQCEVVSDGAGILVNASLTVLPAGENSQDTQDCQYPLIEFSRGERRHRSLACGRQTGCALHCDLQQLSGAPLFRDDQCRAVLGDPQMTFWLYFGLRAAAESFLSLALVLVSATTLLLRRRHGSDHGREALWGLLGLAITAPLTGYLLDTQRTADGSPDLRPGLCAYAALLLAALTLAALVTVRPGVAHDSREYSRRLARSVCAAEFFGVLCALAVLGALWGFLETFLAGHASGMGGSHLQTGLGTTAGALLLIPLMAKAEALIAYCGHHHVFMVAFIVYIVRYVSYAYIVSAWLLLVAESLEMFTVHLAWLSAVQLSSLHGRPVVEATLQAAVTVAHFGVGRGVGAGVVRYVLPLFSPFVVLCAGSILSAVCAALYLSLYHCCRALAPYRRGTGKRRQYLSDGAMLNGTTNDTRPNRW